MRRGKVLSYNSKAKNWYNSGFNGDKIKFFNENDIPLKSGYELGFEIAFASTGVLARSVSILEYHQIPNIVNELL